MSGSEDENEDIPKSLKPEVELSPSTDIEEDEEESIDEEESSSDDSEDEVDEFDLDEEEEEPLPSRLSSIFQTQANVEDMARIEIEEAAAKKDEMMNVIMDMQSMFDGIESNFVVFAKSITRKEKTRLLQYILFNKEVAAHTGVAIGSVRGDNIVALDPTVTKDAKVINAISRWLDAEGVFLENEGWKELAHPLEDYTFDGGDYEWHLHTLVEAPYPSQGGDGSPEEPDDGYVPDATEEDTEEEEEEETVHPDTELLKITAKAFNGWSDDFGKPWNNNPESKLAILTGLYENLDALLTDVEVE